MRWVKQVSGKVQCALELAGDKTRRFATVVGRVVLSLIRFTSPDESLVLFCLVWRCETNWRRDKTSCYSRRSMVCSRVVKKCGVKTTPETKKNPTTVVESRVLQIELKTRRDVLWQTMGKLPPPCKTETRRRPKLARKFVLASSGGAYICQK